MDSEDKFWLFTWITVAAALVFIVAIGCVYSNATNEKILQADTCEKVMAINGEPTERFMLCATIKSINK